MENLNKLGVLELHDCTLKPLKAGESWISKSDNSLETGRIVGFAYADVDGRIYIEQSGDGLAWDIPVWYDVAAGAGWCGSIEKIAQHARVRFVNGTMDQTVFRLYVYRRIRVP